MIGTSAALAWSMASIVWGMTPSSAATTRIDDVGRLGAPGAHGGEGGVARRVDEGDRVALPLDLVGADVLGDATGLAGDDVGGADPVEQERLAVVDVTHDGHHGRTRPLVGLVFLLLVLEVARQELGLLLLARVDQPDVGADLGREELDHVVGQRLRGHHHLALEQQETHDVTGAAVELRPEVARRGAPLDDDLAVGNRRGRGLVGGELGRLELLDVAPASTGPALGRPPTRHPAATSSGRCARRSAGTRPTAEAATRDVRRSRPRPTIPASRPEPPGGRPPVLGGYEPGARVPDDELGAVLGRRPPMPGGGGIGRPLGPSGGRAPGGGGTGLPEGLRGGRAGRDCSGAVGGAAVSGALAAGDWAAGDWAAGALAAGDWTAGAWAAGDWAAGAWAAGDWARGACCAGDPLGVPSGGRVGAPVGRLVIGAAAGAVGHPCCREPTPRSCAPVPRPSSPGSSWSRPRRSTPPRPSWRRLLRPAPPAPDRMRTSSQLCWPRAPRAAPGDAALRRPPCGARGPPAPPRWRRNGS